METTQHCEAPPKTPAGDLCLKMGRHTMGYRNCGRCGKAMCVNCGGCEDFLLNHQGQETYPPRGATPGQKNQ